MSPRKPRPTTTTTGGFGHGKFGHGPFGHGPAATLAPTRRLLDRLLRRGA